MEIWEYPKNGVSVKVAHRNRLRWWMKRHSPKVVVFGAFVTLMSFICKDLIRDYYKDSSDEVRGAITDYNVGVLTSPFEPLFETTSDDLSKFTDEQKLAESDPRQALGPYGPARKDLDRLMDRYWATKEKTNNYISLIDSLPCGARGGTSGQSEAKPDPLDPRSCGDTVLDLYRRLSHRDLDSVQKSISTAGSLLSDRSEASLDPQKRAREAIGEIGAATTICLNLEQRLRNKGRDAKRLAGEYAASRKHKSRLADCTVATLFMVGWILGLYGSLQETSALGAKARAGRV